MYAEEFGVEEFGAEIFSELEELQKIHGRKVIDVSGDRDYAYVDSRGMPTCACERIGVDSPEQFLDWASGQGWSCRRCGIALCDYGDVSCDGREIGCDLYVCPRCSKRENAWWSREDGNWCSPGCKYHTEQQRLPPSEVKYDREEEKRIEEADREWSNPPWFGSLRAEECGG